MTIAHRADAIAIVDDDLRVRQLLGSYLSQEGFEVFEAENGASLSSILRRRAIDLIVLDLLLPDEDGFSICQRLRANGIRIPIIILSAQAQDTDRIAGLMMGADDYVRKPFNPREIRARIQAILRRSPPREEPGGPSSRNEVVRFGPFEFNLGTRTLRRDGQILGITTVQIAILKVLVRHAGQPLSREKLAQVARGRELGAFERSLDVQVSRLRKLLQNGPFSYILTVWGVGYMFDPSGEGGVVRPPDLDAKLVGHPAIEHVA
ncbi:response regulator [Variovorax sp. Root434]|uniref:response regulator n=1 Tax=unclassified Variovorax TaxID=663243 RepID=UPI0006FB1A56|nr:response regulator [Variovorax sp. Root434]KQX29462.1 two-component system response regulator [Variovorax sp. Root434]